MDIWRLANGERRLADGGGCGYKPSYVYLYYLCTLGLASLSIFVMDRYASCGRVLGFAGFGERIIFAWIQVV